MKKRTFFIGVILFLSTFSFLEVSARSNVNNTFLVQLRPIPGVNYSGIRLFNKAGKNYQKGNFKEAIKLFSKYIIKYQTSEDDYVRDAYYYRAYSKGGIGDYDGAISDFTKAIEIYSEYTAAYLYRGFAKFKIGDLKGACLDAKKTVSLGYINEKHNDWIKNNCKTFQ